MIDMFTSEAVTRGVRVAVRVRVRAGRPVSPADQWFFLYTITITNEGAETVQLMTRHWIITDGTGHVEEVKGPGVVGKQPMLAPGRVVHLHVRLPARDAVRHDGRHLPDGRRRAATSSTRKIAPFTLSEPYTVH